jgi:hypothetical protein
MIITGFGSAAEFSVKHQSAFKTALSANLPSAVTQDHIHLVVGDARRLTYAFKAGGDGTVEITYKITGVTVMEASMCTFQISQIVTDSGQFVLKFITELFALDVEVPTGLTVEATEATVTEVGAAPPLEYQLSPTASPTKYSCEEAGNEVCDPASTICHDNEELQTFQCICKEGFEPDPNGMSQCFFGTHTPTQQPTEDPFAPDNLTPTEENLNSTLAQNTELVAENVATGSNGVPCLDEIAEEGVICDLTTSQCVLHHEASGYLYQECVCLEGFVRDSADDTSCYRDLSNRLIYHAGADTTLGGPALDGGYL